MEKREEALCEALKRNEEETDRWRKYKEENEIAVENLDIFSKYLTVDVMVPIGQKAFMPGQLIHTNEVLVSHYQGYFSKCSAHKAKEVCEYRLKTALETIEKLKTESVLWQNKLEKPQAEGVFPNMNDCEIIEDYDEDKERVWREKHKILLKQAKVREKFEREHEGITYANELKTSVEDEIMKKLDERELMEELENELENLQIDDISNETIRKLMAGDMKLPPEKNRQAHISKNSATQNQEEFAVNIESSTNNVCSTGLLHGIVKKTDLNTNTIQTNNNHRPNPEFAESFNNNYNNESDNDDVEGLPQEIQVIKEQAKYLSVEEQIGFYEYQIKIMRQKLLTLPLKTQKDIDQKVHILNILETLEELLEIAEDYAEAQDEENVDLREQEIKENQYLKSEKQQKRRISFALQDETLEFRKNETVSQMLPKPQSQTKDVIKIDVETSKLQHAKAKDKPSVIVDRKQNILKKVEQNVKFIEENQSTRDFKLVDKILESTVGASYTLHIHFQHSNIPRQEVTGIVGSDECDNMPGSPADFYQLYLQNVGKDTANIEKIIFTNSYNGEEKVKVPFLKETERSKAYEDQRMKYCKPVEEAKSILRNKSAVEHEKHNLDRKNRASAKKNSKNNRAVPVNEDEYMSAYYKVMNEVVEKALTEPEPLPECKYIDAHTPKKRISRFKQNRSGAEKL